jgi:hypothetical protein
VDHRLVGDDHVVGGATADVDHGDGGAQTLLGEGDLAAFVGDDMVVPGGQGLGDDVMEGDGCGQATVDGIDGLLEARALLLHGLGTLAAVLEVEGAHRQAGDGMDRVASVLGLLHPVLDDDPVQSGEGVAFEVGRLAIDLASGINGVFGLVLGDLMLGLVEPGDIGAADTYARGNRHQPAVRERKLGEGIAVVEADADGFGAVGVRHCRLFVSLFGATAFGII